MDDSKRAELVRRWWRALAVDADPPLSAEHGQALLTAAAADLTDALGAEPFDAADGARVGAALAEAGLTDPSAPVRSARVLYGLADDDPRPDARERLAALLAALAQGHQIARCRAHDLVGEPNRPDIRDDRYRMLFDNAVVGIALGAVDGTLIEVNPSLAAMFGTTPEMLRGASVLDFADPGEREQIRTRIATELLTNAVGSVLLDRSLAGADGAITWLSFAITHVKGVGAHPGYLLTLGGDDTERRILQQELHYQARHDPLTGLPNRRRLLERLDELILDAGENDRIGLCFADLDHFKQVNDRYGHGTGDKILTAIAARLREIAAEQNCLIARIGGDEFVALIPPPADPDRVRATADRLLGQVTTPFTVGARQLRVSASIGAVVAPLAGADAESVLDAADTSLYRAKTEKGRWVLRTLHSTPRRGRGAAVET